MKYKKQEMIPLTDEETKFYEEQKVCHTCKKRFVMMKMKKMNLNYSKKSDIFAITQENLEELLKIFAI